MQAPLSSLFNAPPSPPTEVGQDPLPSEHLHLAVEALRDELTRIDVADNYWLSQLHHRLSSVLGACLEYLPTPDADADRQGALSINARAEGIDEIRFPR